MAFPISLPRIRSRSVCVSVCAEQNDTFGQKCCMFANHLSMDSRWVTAANGTYRRTEENRRRMKRRWRSLLELARSQSISATNSQLFNCETNVLSQERFSWLDILWRMIIRMTVAVEEVASTYDVGWKVPRQTITRSRFRFKDGRLFDQSGRCHRRSVERIKSKRGKKKKTQFEMRN